LEVNLLGKHFGEPYDPELRTSEHGSKLYTAWRAMRKHPHCEEWESFLNFYTWSMQNDYSLGARLHLLYDTKPYCPENCIWYTRHREEDDPLPPAEWAEVWNETVNRIRKHYGMPPLG
jgi:hypothetical protein